MALPSGLKGDTERSQPPRGIAPPIGLAVAASHRRVTEAVDVSSVLPSGLKVTSRGGPSDGSSCTCRRRSPVATSQKETVCLSGHVTTFLLFGLKATHPPSPGNWGNG